MNGETTGGVDERNFRPAALDDYIGQGHAIPALRLMLRSVTARGALLEHVLFYGEAGVGKTTLAYCIANELGLAFKELGAPSIERVGDLVSVLVGLPVGGSVLFIDEIHRLDSKIAESIYPALEDWKVTIPLDRREEGRQPITVKINPFTLVGATTHPGLLPKPLLDRFGQQFFLKPHTLEESIQVVNRLAFMRDVEIDDESAKIIAARCRGVPRIANRLFRRAYDLAIDLESPLDTNIAREAMRIVRVDQYGLTDVERTIVFALADHFNGGPVGKQRLAASVNVDLRSFEELVSPFLESLGLATGKGSSGWLLTRKGWGFVNEMRADPDFGQAARVEEEEHPEFVGALCADEIPD